MDLKFKYPSTYHLPNSPGATSDDKVLQATSCFEDKYVVITEKMDGECTSLYGDYYHARSLDSRDHPSRSWVKQFHASIKHDIPRGYRICGENLYAQHSLRYENLKSYFYCFSIWNEENYCLSWDDTVEWCRLLNITTVPVLYIGYWDDSVIHNININPNIQEGYVVRNYNEFHYDEFSKNVAKWVRPNHIQTSTHWMNQTVIPNKLID